jgi:ribosomal protein S18 acetylase RimI-like enzyme
MRNFNRLHLTMDKGPPYIIRARLNHVPGLVKLHQQTNPDSYLTSLGQAALSKLYSRFILDPKGIALAALSRTSDRVIGTTLGCVSPQKFYWALGWILLPFYLKKWVKSVAFGQQKLFDGLRRMQTQNSLLPKGKICYLAQINVSPHFQRTHVATELMRYFHRHMISRGLHRSYTIVDLNNKAAKRLYESSGYTLCTEFTSPAGDDRCLYYNDLTSWEFANDQKTGRAV